MKNTALITGQDGAYLTRIAQQVQPNEFYNQCAMRDVTDSFESTEYTANVDGTSALCDWGHARDYVERPWLMLQQDYADDFVIATSVQYSVRQFVEFAAGELGVQFTWHGEGANEQGVVAAVAGNYAKCQVGDVIVKGDPRYSRPTEVESLLGDPTKANEKLGWVPKTTLKELVAELVQADFTSAKRDALVKLAGFQTFDHHE